MMERYEFTTEQGWKVRMYRPVSLGQSVRSSPGFLGYDRRGCAGLPQAGEAPTDDLFASMTAQRLRFNHYSLDVLRRLLDERLQMHYRSRKDLLGQIADVSGEVYSCMNLKSLESQRRKVSLDKTKLDLEKQLRDEDVVFWRDVSELRRDLLAAYQSDEGARLRTAALMDKPVYDDNKNSENAMGTGYMPGLEAPYREESR